MGVLRNTFAASVAVALALAAAACTVSTTGAPCDTRDNCPKGQFCAQDKVCHSNQKNAPCDTDDHCPEGQHCAAGTCTEGAAPADAGIDAGTDAGIDAGIDAGKVNCAIDDNCKTAHVSAGTCESGRCNLTCEKGWEDANDDPSDGCEKEVCNPAGWETLTMDCRQTWDCKCGNHCVAGMAGATAGGLGQCLEDCDFVAPRCHDPTAKCLPIVTDGSTVTQANCFKTGRLTGDFKILVLGACDSSPGPADLRSGNMRMTIGGLTYKFDTFTACLKVESDNKTYINIEGFTIVQAQPMTPGPDVIYFGGALADSFNQAEIQMYQGKPEANFVVVHEAVTFNGFPNVTAITLHGVGSSGKIFNIVKGNKLPNGQEYTGSVDIEMMKYDVDMCGGPTGKPCTF